MFKEKNYLIKSVNYYEGINNENEDKFSGSFEHHKIKNTNNGNISINKNCQKNNIKRTKQYKEIKYFNQRKNNISSLSGEIQLSLDKNDTLINNNNLSINNDIIYKRMLETNNNKRKEVQAIKIIKCEKINMTNKNKILQTNKKTRNYPFLLTQINSQKNLLLKTDSTNSNDNNNNSFNKEIVNTIKIKRNNKKDQNKICMNHSLTFISEKKGSLTERKIDKTHKKFLLRNRLKNPVIKNKIEDKGYLDSTDFMNVVNEDNNLKKNKKVIFDNKAQKKNKVNITIPEKKIIEILKKINAGNFKKKEKEKRNIEEANNNKILMVNNGISKNNGVKTEENKKININNRCNNDIENLNKEIEELKNNLNNKNFKDTRKELINKFQDKNKEENKSLKVSQSKKDNYKTLKYKIIDGQKDNEIASKINKFDEEKEIKKENIKIKFNNENIINKENFNRINQRNQDGIINKEVIKNNKNLVLNTKKLGINLTKKIKKYYSLKNKTLEEVNNNSYKNLLNKEIKKDISKLESNINNKKNINRQLEINEINNNSRKNSDLMNEIYFFKTEINNNNNNIKSCEIEKSNVLINNQNDTKQNLNLTTRDETFKTYNNSKDIENNEFNNFAKESVNDNNQVKSCESQVISGINGPNTTYFSGFNKSELKMLNKINLDMPINLDLCNEDNKDFKEDNLKDNLDEIKINIKENKENKKMNNTLTLKDKKFEKLENFINKFNENEGEIEEGKIIHFHNETPLYGRSIADVNFILNDVNSNINNDINKNKKNIIKKTESDINKIKSNFYDDINYEKEDYKNKKNIKSYSCNNLDFLDINDLPNNDQDFIDNIELIQKNNFILISNNEIKEDKNKNETIKEIDTEYEFNLNEDKFCVPLQKYEEKSFNKINPF